MAQNDSRSRHQVKCYSCEVEMQLARKAKFRIGGTRGEWKIIFGEWAELGEELLPLNIYVCPNCGRIKLFAEEKLIDALLGRTPKAFLKKCIKCGKEIPIASEECPLCGTRNP